MWDVFFFFFGAHEAVFFYEGKIINKRWGSLVSFSSCSFVLTVPATSAHIRILILVQIRGKEQMIFK